MIKANELRIGNLTTGSRGVRTVQGIRDNRIYFDDDEGTTVYANDERVMPIPITPEWLERLGFESSISPKGHENWIKYDAKHLAFVLREITPFIGFTYHSYGTDHSVELKSVHQLQNIYFALTGEELTVKE